MASTLVPQSVRAARAPSDVWRDGCAPVLIVTGNPNVGKSLLFQHLTGRYATVSNYPGTTVMVTRGTSSLNGRAYEVCDTPGLNSLLAGSEDELVAPLAGRIVWSKLR